LQKATPVLVPSGSHLLGVGVPSDHIRVLAEVEVYDIEGGNGGEDGNIGHG